MPTGHDYCEFDNTTKQLYNMETLKESSLNVILESFKGVREISDEHLKMEKLQKQFCSMAKELLYGGYFLVEGKTRLYLDDIEFYYHEEGEEGLKDPIMYHTNDHEGKEIPYFEIGRLNLHISGIDVTFENEEMKYRASFLIRGFHVDNDEYDPHSTHVYDKMVHMGVPMGKPIEIEWISKRLPGYESYDPKGEARQNVAEYELQDGKYKKIEYLEKGEYNKDDYFHYNKHVYKKCQREWRFKKNKP